MEYPIEHTENGVFWNLRKSVVRTIIMKSLGTIFSCKIIGIFFKSHDD